MKKLRYAVLLALLVPFILLSCKTASGPDSLVDTSALTGDPLGPPSGDALSAVARARAAADESRDKAEYVKGDEYFPIEWEAAGELYSQAAGKEAPETQGEAIARVGEWNNVNIAYYKIYRDSMEQFCAVQAQVLAQAREDAVNAGAEELVPDRLKQADELAASAQAKADKKDYAGSVVDGKAARDRYRILQTLAEASARQKEVDDLDFFHYDPENYELATNKGNTAVDLYDQGNLIDARDAADESLLRYNLVLKNGYVGQTEAKAKIAGDLRQAAQDQKAHVAVRAEFEAADKVYNEAHAAFRQEDYAGASELFDESAELFKKSSDNAAVKRQRAEDALLDAEESLAGSDERAKAADEIIGGGN
ncbi:MAG: hypothetical protein LBJ31_10900 [Treponema sp.]|jgi:hypothetical protein|nr:hypothetical protein [Treponema sp.]